MLLAAAVILSLNSWAQSDAAQSAFNEMFPDVQDAEWEEMEGEYEVFFIEGDIECWAVFGEDGECYEIARTTENIEDIPENIVEAAVNELDQKGLEGDPLFIEVVEIPEEEDEYYGFYIEIPDGIYYIEVNSKGEVEVSEMDEEGDYDDGGYEDEDYDEDEDGKYEDEK